MIKIICLGKIKEKSMENILDDYLYRIKKYINIEIIELQDEGFDDRNFVLKKEKEKILKILDLKSYIITLEIMGQEMNSIEFSKKIDSILLNNSNITFIIGGSYGLHDEIKSIADFSLSFSKMTFPHQLFRVMLTEQIYRAFKILNNEKYHK